MAWQYRRQGIHPRAPVILLVAQFGCSGLIGGTSDGSSSVNPSDIPEESARDQPRVATGFDFAVSELRLLPFSVRLSRLAHVVDRGVDDAALVAIRNNAVALGAANYAEGIQPDRLWTASRITAWVKAIVPFCESDAFYARYPRFPESLPTLIETAYGRPYREDDDAILEDLDTLTDDNARHRATCVAVLSSAEFVLRS